MITKVLLVDPSIGFAVGIKRALEQPGGYRVTTFANGQAALDLVREEAQDVAILDFEPDDMDIVRLITALREIQPDLSILVSPRTDPQLARVPSLDVQGSINKPYLVRQLIPAIRDVLAARARLTAAASLADSQPIALLDAAEQAEAPADTMDTPSNGVPIMHGSDDFDAALASLSLAAPDPEMFTTPDDRFHRHLSAMQANAPITTAGLRKTLENFAMPPTAEDSTLAEAIGATSGTTADVTVPPPLSLTAALSDIAQNVQTSDYQDYPGVLDAPDNALAAYSTPESNIEPSFVAALTAVTNPDPDPTDDSAESDMDSAAEIAARLTHLAMQSTAYATILTRAGALVASAGELSARAVAGVVETIAQIWQTTDDDDAASDDSTALPPRIRYIQVPGVGDFALYSIRTIAELYLSVLFPADTSLRLIRQQARRLIGSLEQGSIGTASGIVSANDEPEAAKTLLSRPTEPLIPNGLREAMAAQGISTAADREADADYDYDTAVDNSQHEDTDQNSNQPDHVDQAMAPASPPTLVTIPDVPYSPYTLMWLPRTEALLMDIADQLPGWINTAASARAWKVSESTISAGCVSVRIDLPADQTPRGAIDMLQYATAERADVADLWSDSYYVIASERAVTPAEIASFVDYRRQANVH